MQKVVVRYLSGSKKGQVESFDLRHHDSLVIGRDPVAAIRFESDTDNVVSRNHAMIEWDDADPPIITVSDLLSSNGTYVNDAPIKQGHSLRSGDRVRLGQSGPEVEVQIKEVGAEVESGAAPGPQEAGVPGAIDPAKTRQIPLVDAKQGRPGGSGSKR